MLMILDGYGYSANTEGNAIYAAKTPVMDKLLEKYETVSWSAFGQTARYRKEEDMVL